MRRIGYVLRALSAGVGSQDRTILADTGQRNTSTKTKTRGVCGQSLQRKVTSVCVQITFNRLKRMLNFETLAISLATHWYLVLTCILYEQR